jgi:hypothetical protein
VLTLSLSDAMCVAARNDRRLPEYEGGRVYLRARSRFQQYQFETTFSGMMLGRLSGDRRLKGPAVRTAGGVARKLENGAEIAGSLALDVVSLLRDDWRSLGLTGDLT